MREEFWGFGAVGEVVLLTCCAIGEVHVQCCGVGLGGSEECGRAG